MQTISIIIPTYNDRVYLEKTIDTLVGQQPDSFQTEIIVVDNGSTDGTIDFLSKKSSIICLSETVNLNSPYSCRNRGIEIATGNIIVLLDATCVPDKNWLEKGVNFLVNSDAHVVGGNVLFDFEGKLTAAKVFDALTNIRMRESIETRGVAKTANLFIKKRVFDEVGLFPEGVRSGADVRWTHKVSSKGLGIQFCPDSIVYKPARGFWELLKKQWRVGVHQPLIWIDLNKRRTILQCLKKIFIPVSPLSIKRLLKRQGTNEMEEFFLRVWMVAQIVKVTMGIANIWGILRLKMR